MRRVQTLLGWQSSPGNLWGKPKLCACVLSRFILVRLFATPWAVAHQAPLSVGFSKQEYWSGLPHPPPGDLPNPGVEPASLMSPALAVVFLTTSTTCSVQFSSITQPCLTLCDPMDCRTPGLPVHHQLLEFTQTHVHRVSDGIQPSNPVPYPPALNLSQHHGLFK